MEDSEFFTYKIELILNTSGYKGQEIDELLPDFMTDRPVSVGLAWAPSAEGPESLTLLIVIGAATAKIAEGFLSELGKDLYTWAKNKILPLLSKKRYPTGHVVLEVNDVTLDFYFEAHDETNKIDFLRFLEDFPIIVSKVDPKKSREWFVRYDHEFGDWAIQTYSSMEQDG